MPSGATVRGSVPAGDIGQRAHGAAMETTLLLRHALGIRQRHLAAPRRRRDEPRAQRAHHALADKTGLDALERVLLGRWIFHRESVRLH